MDVTLTDRYVEAVVRTIPERQRADVARELHAAIADQLDARVEGGESGDAAEREVLTELGDPDRLAAEYADRPLQLIGPRYYLVWRRLLVLLLWIVPICAAAGVALAQMLAGATAGGVVGAVIPVVLSVIVHTCFWVTLVFALIERTGGAAPDAGRWTPDRLPEPRASGARASDLIGGLVWIALLAAAIVWDLARGFVFTGGAWTSFLNPALWSGGVVVLIAMMLAELALTALAFRAGRWTVGLAVANAVLAVVSAFILLWMLGAGLLVNPALYDLAVASGAGVDLPRVIAGVTGFTIVGVAVWDAVDGFLKARRAAGAIAR